MGLRPETLTGDFATPARSHFQRPVLQSPAFFPAVIRSVLSVPLLLSCRCPALSHECSSHKPRLGPDHA